MPFHHRVSLPDGPVLDVPVCWCSLTPPASAQAALGLVASVLMGRESSIPRRKWVLLEGLRECAHVAVCAGKHSVYYVAEEQCVKSVYSEEHVQFGKPSGGRECVQSCRTFIFESAGWR